MLKAILASLDGIPEHYHDLYTERNGQYELTGIEGVRSQADIDRLQSSLNKERNDFRSLRERVSVFGDRKFEDILAELDRIPELEAAAAAADGNDEKIQQLLDARMRTKLAPLERTLSQKDEAIASLTAKIEQYEQRDRTRMIHDEVRGAITKLSGFQPSAVEDALMYAERMFEVDEDGRVLTKDQVGVTPGIDAQVWLTEMQQKKAHWWGPSVGGGANGGSKKSFSSNPWSKDGWNMTEQGRIFRENPQRAHQMAKSAGTSVGGAQPQ